MVLEKVTYSRSINGAQWIKIQTSAVVVISKTSIFHRSGV